MKFMFLSLQAHTTIGLAHNYRSNKFLFLSGADQMVFAPYYKTGIGKQCWQSLLSRLIIATHLGMQPQSLKMFQLVQKPLCLATGIQ